ncbi:MAG: HTH domain-containing protein [Candidatus Paceibacterota bacterium]
MITDTAEKIIKYIKLKQQVTAHELTNYLGISRQAFYKQITKLIKDESIYKTGQPPKVFYLIKGKSVVKKDEIVKPDIKKIIDKNYLIITPAGEMKNGVDGFSYWCSRNNLPFGKTAEEYVKTLAKYDVWKKDGMIDGTQKLKGSFKEIGLDKMFYLDFYAIERFGKTRLGQLLLYAKQSQDKKMIKNISEEARSPILKLIKKYQIDAVAFIPPTVKREVQLIKELKNQLSLPLMEINLVKAKTEVIVPQKTLSKLEDRIENARKSIFVNDKKTCRNILMIDDAVGSGATLNETALQIKKMKVCSGKIIGLAITGSFKGFDVISEV